MKRILIGASVAVLLAVIVVSVRGWGSNRAQTTVADQEADSTVRSPAAELVEVGEAPEVVASTPGRTDRESHDPERVAEEIRDVEEQGSERSPGSVPAEALPASEETDERPSTAVAGPDVEVVLRAASEAYERVGSLQAEFVMRTQNPLLQSDVESHGTLFQRRPDRFLMRFSDPEGDVIVSDGEHIWIYYPSADERQVIRAPAGEGGTASVDLQAQFLGDPVARFDATLEDREAVRGRDAYQIRMIPREYTGYEELRVWIDVDDHLARRFEITEESGVVRRIVLDELEIDPSLSDDLFHFTPPPNAQIIDRR